jgi:hypothetical protein
MNKSRLARLEKMARRDSRKGYLVVTREYGRDKYYFKDDPSRIYPSAQDAVKAWESQHGELPRNSTVVVITNFKNASKLHPI